MTSYAKPFMRFLIFLVLLSSLAVLSSGAAETDWGGTLQGYLDGSNVENRELTVGFNAGIWSETDFSAMARLTFSGGYGFQYDKGNFFHVPNLQLLSMSGRNNTWSYTAGRFTMGDRQGKLFSALLDGAEFNSSGTSLTHSAGIGFTGLAFNRTSRVIMTAIDQRAFDNAKPFSLASPRLGLYYEFSSDIKTGADTTDPRDHTLSVVVLGEIDLRSADAVANEGPSSSMLHSGYLQLGMNGRFSSTFDYMVNGIFQMGANTIPNDSRTLLLAGGLAEGSVSWHPGGSLKPMIVGEILYSSGDPWDQRSDWEGTQYGSGSSLNQYTAFTTRTVGYVFGSRVGNLGYGRLGASIRPVEMLSLKLDNYLYFRSVEGPVNEMPITATSGSDLYLGDEIILTVDFRPLSDLGLQLNGGIFLANGNIIQDNVQYRLGASLSMSF
ncbi:MAG: hypothetical protein KAH21_02285 [Spirochaetaceae bacterium]|nr:hypothetical protein [Spirochaetaceae bacterium]